MKFYGGEIHQWMEDCGCSHLKTIHKFMSTEQHLYETEIFQITYPCVVSFSSRASGSSPAFEELLQ